MHQLSSSDRGLAREVARECWLKSKDELKCERLFRTDPRVCDLSFVTIVAMLNLAFLLWRWWRLRQIVEPSVVAGAGEPGAEDE